MKKSFMSNIKHFVDSNVRPRIDRVANNNNHFFGDDLLLVERQFEDLRQICIAAEKQQLTCCPLSTKADSLLANTFNQCSQLQAELTKLYLNYEQAIEVECLKPLQQVIEVDAPNVIKLKKHFIKSHHDLDSIRNKYNSASQKQQSQQTVQNNTTCNSYTLAQNTTYQSSVSKLEQLRKELDDAITRFEQAKDTYATELYAFVCREPELVELFIKFYENQAIYQQKVGSIIQQSLPNLRDTLANISRKVVFGTALEEHLRCTGKSVSLVMELCVHLLYSHGLNEEGIFRIPGSSVKIKKLKNAINAWFVTSDNQSDVAETSNNHAQTQTSLLTIHDMFKDIAGQRIPVQNTLACGSGGGGGCETSQAKDTIVIAGGREDSTLTQSTNSTSSTLKGTTTSTLSATSHQESHHVVYDVHTIAGLLKLYLRELPEPLLTYDLYDKLIDVTVRKLNKNTDDQSDHDVTLKTVIEQLPKSNYDNLHLLIRFLNLLTKYQDSNKMTSTNLAITMAPSLIRVKPIQQVVDIEQNSANDEHNPENDLRDINMQMSSIGMSASLHALVVESLINEAETLFPGESLFIIPELKDIVGGDSSERNNKQQANFSAITSKLKRSIKSVSPTGLSTASSSSFSSNGSSSSSSTNKKHDRKGGSMEGLLDDKNLIPSLGQPSRPYSVYVQQNHHHQPPPIPPAPASRSHSRHASDSSPSILSSNSNITQPSSGANTSHKPPAPPIPPPCTLKRQPKLTSNSSRSIPNEKNSSEDTLCNNAIQTIVNAPSRPTVGSLRGTGSVRPTVPPPSLPSKQTEVDNGVEKNDEFQEGKAVDENNPHQLEDKSSNSASSSGGNLAGEFEEINAVDLDEIDISVPVSPVISLDSISQINDDDDDDSSFDDSRGSLETSWEQQQQQLNNKTMMTAFKVDPSQQLSAHVVDHQQKEIINKKPAPLPRKRDNVEKTSLGRGSRATSNQDEDREAINAVPVKPPRSKSPKVTQSTPL